MCVTDAIWSIGVDYVRHVLPVMDRFDSYRDRFGLAIRTSAEYLDHFNEHLDDEGAWLADHIYFNHQRTSTASGIMKSFAIQQTLQILNDEQLQTPHDLLAKIADTTLRARLKAVPGDSIGVRTDYIFMLSGCTELAKLDGQISRFLGIQFNSANRLIAIGQLTAVTALLKAEFPCVNVRSIDHFIWKWQSRSDDGFERHT